MEQGNSLNMESVHHGGFTFVRRASLTNAHQGLDLLRAALAASVSPALTLPVPPPAPYSQAGYAASRATSNLPAAYQQPIQHVTRSDPVPQLQESPSYAVTSEESPQLAKSNTFSTTLFSNNGTVSGENDPFQRFNSNGNGYSANGNDQFQRFSSSGSGYSGNDNGQFQQFSGGYSGSGNGISTVEDRAAIADSYINAPLPTNVVQQSAEMSEWRRQFEWTEKVIIGNKQMFGNTGFRPMQLVCAKCLCSH